MAACGDSVLDRGRIWSKGMIGVGVVVPEQNRWPSVWGTARVRVEGEIQLLLCDVEISEICWWNWF